MICDANCHFVASASISLLDLSNINIRIFGSENIRIFVTPWPAPVICSNLMILSHGRITYYGAVLTAGIFDVVMVMMMVLVLMLIICFKNKHPPSFSYLLHFIIHYIFWWHISLHFLLLHFITFSVGTFHYIFW